MKKSCIQGTIMNTVINIFMCQWNLMVYARNVVAKQPIDINHIKFMNGSKYLIKRIL